MNMVKLDEAVTKYGASLFRYCAGVLCDYHEAQDAVQETFIKAYAGQATYTHDTNFGGWLYRIAYTTCVSMLRKRRFRLMTEREKAGQSRIPAADEGSHFLSEELVRALRTLTPEERSLLFARAVDDMDYRRMSQVFGASEAALRKRYERARKKLQENFQDLKGELLCTR